MKITPISMPIINNSTPELNEANLKRTLDKFVCYPLNDNTVYKMQSTLSATYNMNADVIKYENGIDVSIGGLHVSLLV